MSTPKHLLLTFAHPDDESNLAGSTIAKYSAEGADVLVVIVTRGEVGEIAPDSAATREMLGAVREAKLRVSVAILGASLALLDYRDFGMPGAPENANRRAFVQAPADEVVGKLVTLIRQQKPQVVTNRKYKTHFCARPSVLSTRSRIIIEPQISSNDGPSGP
jgi:LmbE family N-acetylglucosaminyl deacetylase